MPATDLCPGADLERRLRSPRDAAEAEQLARHLQRCERCAALAQRLRASGDHHTTPSAAQPDAPTLPPAGAVPLAPPQAGDEIGRLAHYRVLKRLGAGGMGQVFLAVDTLLERRVALKVMLPALAAEAVHRDRFLREARAAAALTHDHVVTIHQVGEADGVPYLAMQLLEGESLEDYLRRGKSLTPGQVCRIGREAANGLAAAHAKGLVHRDVKPANLWLEAPRGRVKLLDFGLARPTGDVHLTSSGQVLGTPTYMAPEQARGQVLDGRCDLWSLGVVLYRLCTGRLPFEGTDVLAVITSIALDEPPPVRALAPDTPPALAELITELLAKDPAGRPKSARAVADRLLAIERALAQAKAAAAATSALPPSEPTDDDGTLVSPTEARTAPRPAPAPRRAGAGAAPRRGRKRRPRRRWAWIVALVGGLVALAAYPAWVLFRDRDGRPVAGFETADDGPPAGPVSEEAIAEDGPVPDVAAEPLPPGTPVPWRAILTGHGKSVSFLAFTPDGQTLVSASRNELFLRDATFGRFQSSSDTTDALFSHNTVKQFALSPNGRTLAIAANGPRQARIMLRDLASGRDTLLRGSETTVTALAWSPDGLVLAGGHFDGRVSLWDVAERRELATFADVTSPVRALAFAPGGGRLAAGGADGTAVVWEVAARQVLCTIPTGAGVARLAFTPDGRTLVTHSRLGGLLQRWGPATGQRQGEPARYGRGSRMAVSPDGRFAALGYTAGPGRTGVRIVELATGQTKLVTAAGHAGWLAALAWSPNGRTLATATGLDTDTSIRLWDVSNLPPPPPLEPPARDLACSRTDRGFASAPLVLEYIDGGKTLVVVDRERAWLRNTATGVYRSQPIGAALRERYRGAVARAALAPDGKTLALAVHAGQQPTAPHRVVLWDLAHGQEQGVLPISGRVVALAFRSDSLLLATGDTSEMQLWNLRRPLKDSRFGALAEANVTDLAFAPRGPFLAVGKSDGTVRVWNVNLDGQRWSGATRDGTIVHRLAYSPDGRWLAAVSANQTYVRVWNALNGVVQADLAGSGSQLAFSPDGRLLATASARVGGERRHLELYDLTARRAFARSAAQHTALIAALAFAPDGRTVVTGSADQTIKFWGVPKE